MPSLIELRSLLHSFPNQLPTSVRLKALHALLQRSGTPLAGTLEALRTEARETSERLQQQQAAKQAHCAQEVHALEQTLQAQQAEREALIQTYTQQRAPLCQQLIALDEVLLCLGEEVDPTDREDNTPAQGATTLTPSRRARVLGLK